jgi:hypothetical protein
MICPAIAGIPLRTVMSRLGASLLLAVYFVARLSPGTLHDPSGNLLAQEVLDSHLRSLMSAIFPMSSPPISTPSSRDSIGKPDYSAR